jgi:hypothetical protein
MKTTADELCPRCRKIPSGSNGLTLEEYINVIYSNGIQNDDRVKAKNFSDDDYNAMIFSILHKYADVWHCTRCWQLVIDRLPSYMKRS